MSRQRTMRRRMESAETLGSVVTTMKTLASVRVGQYRHAVRALEASNRTLELAIQATVMLNPELLRGAAATEDETVGAVAFGSDRGLCGPFDDRLARHADGLLRHRTEGRGAPALLAVGRRIQRRLEDRGWAVDDRVAPPANLDAITTSVLTVLAHVDRWREAGRADRLFLVYHRPTSAAAYEAEAVQLLPFDPSWLRELHARPWPSRRLPMTLTDADALLRAVIRQYVAHALVRAFAASQASENAARLAAMEAAERNIEDRLAQLRTAYHQARQNAVTEELLDIQASLLGREGGGLE